jgi:F-type H+-transporting ATPase subunit a
MNRLFSLLVLVFTLFVASFNAVAQEEHTAPVEAVSGHAEANEALDIKKIIFDHVGDAHEWHFMTIGENHVTVPLPVILYSPSNGLSMFSSSRFGHEGHREIVDGQYQMVDDHYKAGLLESGMIRLLLKE